MVKIFDEVETESGNFGGVVYRIDGVYQEMKTQFPGLIV